MPHVTTHPLLAMIGNPYYWGRSELKATEMGENILECVLIHQPLNFVCNFAAYINIEYAGTAEQFLQNYGSPVNLAQFIQEHGPLKFVPKPHAEFDGEDFAESEHMAGLHLNHQEDFISPYDDEINAALSEHVLALYQTDALLRQLGLQEPYWSTITHAFTYLEQPEVIEQAIALQPFRNSILSIMQQPVVVSLNYKVREDGRLNAEMNIGHSNRHHENMLEFNLSAELSIHHQDKTVSIENPGQINILVLAYDDEDRDYHLIDIDTWLCDHNGLVPMQQIFNMAVFEEQLKQGLLSHPEVLRSISSQILE